MEYTKTHAKEPVLFNVSPRNLTIDYPSLRKMHFIYSALDAGWAVKKNNDAYVFSRKIERNGEVYTNSYVHEFLEANLNADTAAHK